jgi:Uma2 family endonuclease
MGETATREQLIAQWTELVNDPSLHDLPYKIELTAEGKIQMSPANNWHGMAQAQLAYVLRRDLAGGRVITECSVLTSIGVRVPDVGWASGEFLREQGESTPFTRAPEICVEIVSRSNRKSEVDEKIAAYLAAGAKEVWIVSTAGHVEFHGPDGRRQQSEFPVTVELPPPPKSR